MPQAVTSRPKTDAGKAVILYNGQFGGRYYCRTPRCPLTISAYAHDVQNIVRCHFCRSGNVIAPYPDEVE